jgi:hypothetical protein
MAQIQTNPWLFTNADQATSTAITSIVNANIRGASALVTATAHGLLANAKISIQGAVPFGWNGGYVVQAVPTVNTFLINIPDWKRTLANAGAAGNVLSAAYLDNIRAEQILWDQTSAGQTLLLTNIVGNTVWNPHTTIADTPYTYGKVLWIEGLVINTLPASSNVQITVY